jgi:formate transporter
MMLLQSKPAPRPARTAAAAPRARPAAAKAPLFAAAAAAAAPCPRRRPLGGAAAASAAAAAAVATAAVVVEEQEQQHLEQQQQQQQPRATTSAAPVVAAAPAPPPPPPAPPALLPPPAAFTAAVAAGQTKASLAANPPKLLLLGFLAGAYIGFGALLALTVGGGCGGLAAAGSPGLQKAVAGLVGLPTGLTLVLACGGELVTGNLALCTAAALERKAQWGQVIRAWTLAYAGNILGALAVVALAAGAGLLSPGAAAAAPAAAAAAAKCSLPFTQAVLRGVLANWLVCLAVWMAVSVRDLPSKFLAALLPVSAFVAMGAEHSVANVAIVPAGLVSSGAAGSASAWLDFLVSNLVPVTIGNAIGGAVCVAGAYWAVFGSGGGGGAAAAGSGSSTN